MNPSVPASILVTGAAGQLGSVVLRHLRGLGLPAIGTDLRWRPGLHRANLHHSSRCLQLLKNIRTVIHLARGHAHVNLPGVFIPDDDLQLHQNVFQAAALNGAEKVIFASSIQVISGQRQFSNLPSSNDLAYLPADGDMPARPRNIYGLNKHLSETMLHWFSSQAGFSAVALRFPWLLEKKPDHPIHPWPDYHLDELFTYLSFQDAADLIARLVTGAYPGFRVYLPASRGNIWHRPTPDLCKDYYSTVPWKEGSDPQQGLVNLTRLQEETGWQPHDAPTLRPSWLDLWRKPVSGKNHPAPPLP